MSCAPIIRGIKVEADPSPTIRAVQVEVYPPIRALVLAHTGQSAGGELPADVLRGGVDETETYVILRRANGTAFGRVIFLPFTE